MDTEELQKIELPVLFIWGRNNPFGGVAVGHLAVEFMPATTLESIEAGHIPYPDQPETCAAL